MRSKELTRTTKLQLYTAIIRPVATYAGETWPLNKEHERMLLVFENSILRKIFGPVWDDDLAAWRIRHNVELRELSGLAPVTSFVRAQRLRWAGHVARKPDNAIIKMALTGRPDERRPRGRPRTRWLDVVRRDMQLLGEDPEEWMQLAQDRRQWRHLVAAAKDHPGLRPPE